MTIKYTRAFGAIGGLKLRKPNEGQLPTVDNISQLQFTLPTFSFNYFNSVGDISETIHFNEWSHYCLTKENDPWNMYINGTRKKTFTAENGDLNLF